MNQRLYIHRPCFLLAVCFAIGIWLGTQFPMQVNHGVGVGLILLVGVIVTCKDRFSVGLYVFLMMILGAVSVLNVEILPRSHVGHLTYEQRATISGVEGVVVSEPFIRTTARGTKTSFELRVKRIRFENVWVYRSGKVLVNVFRAESLDYGDQIRLSGKLHKPFQEGFSGKFSYADYLKRNGMPWILSVKKSSSIEIVGHQKASRVRSELYKIRRHLQHVLDRHLSMFEAGVIQSLVLGGRYYIPERTRELFVQTGTAHILAISGMNVGGMAFLIFLILNILRFPRRVQIVGTCLGLMVYCLLTGASPSVVRATVMAVVMLCGLLFERQTDTLNSLGLAGLLIMIFDPMSLFDIGFQLSFMGVFSIIYIYPRLYRLFDAPSHNRFVIIMIQALCISIAAWIGVLPLIAYYFQIVTPVSILANIPIIPFVSTLFMLGCGLIISGWLCPALSVLFAVCIKVVLFVLMNIVNFFSQVPYGYVYLPELGLIPVIGYYLILISVLCFFDRVITHDPSTENLHFLS